MPTASEVHDAAIALAAQALASDAGPDGRPSVRARKKAKKILDLIRDPEQVRAILDEVGGGIEESCVPNKAGKGHHDDRTGHPCAPHDLATPAAKGAAKTAAPAQGAGGKGKTPRRVAAATRDLLGYVGEVPGAAEAAKTWRGKLLSWMGEKIGPKNVARVKVVARVVGAFEEVLGALGTAASGMVADVATARAKEAGLSAYQALEHGERVAKTVGVLDTVSKWTANIPVLHEVLHHALHLGGVAGFVAAKAGYYVPVCSLGYLAAATVAEPLKVARAAAKVIAGKIPWRHAHGGPTHEAVEEGALSMLAAGMASAVAAGAGEWYMALVLHALDAAGLDLAAAVRAADEAIEEHPGPPGDAGDAE